MKILLNNTNTHHKNLNALRKYNIQLVEINDSNLNNFDLSQFDAVYSPGVPLDVTKYPNTKFIFGPQFSVFPNENINMINGIRKNVAYNLLSNWVVNYWKEYPICNNLNFIKLPFGVDTIRFNEIMKPQDKNIIFIYYKSRNPTELQQLLEFFSKYNFNIKVFNYISRYSETEYLECLHNAMFGIWLGRHESQGFALEEALSCNVPLLVWNVTSMNQEYGYDYQDIPATSIPYWDERCGEVFYSITELPSKFYIFINNLQKYKPRDFILENLSINVCGNRFIEFINNM